MNSALLARAVNARRVFDAAELFAAMAAAWQRGTRALAAKYG